MDLFESFSPMKIHWQEKWIRLPYQQTFSGSARITEVQQLLSEFELVFAVPDQLPPSR